jgi:predicted dehydrogenase
MCRSGLIDAVLIATPHYAHTPVALQAFKCGMHVLSEKPLAVHVADADKMIKACPRNRKFAVMFQMRVSPMFRKLKELVDTGELGRIMRVNMVATQWYRTNRYYAGGGWRATWAGEGGGVLINQCPHNLDMLQWICGMPKRIHAHCGFGKWHRLEVEDETTAVLEFANGATGVFIASTAEAPGTNRFEIVGEQGKIVVEDNELRFIRNSESALKFIKTSKRAFATPESREVKVSVRGRDKSHGAIIENFTDAILDGAPLVAPAREGINQVELTNAMIYSGATGKPVDLPLSGRTYKRFLNDLISGKITPHSCRP